MTASMKVQELSGPALDWAVAKCEDRTIRHDPLAVEPGSYWIWEEPSNGKGGVYWRIGAGYVPSMAWEQAGPIIERNSIGIIRADDDFGVGERGFCNNVVIPVWVAVIDFFAVETSTEHISHGPMYQIFEDEVVYGPTPLIAAMRCYVMSKLGVEVEVPDELMEEE